MSCLPVSPNLRSGDIVVVVAVAVAFGDCAPGTLTTQLADPPSPKIHLRNTIALVYRLTM